MADYMEVSMQRLGWGASIYYSHMQVHLTDINRNPLDTPRIYHVDSRLRKVEYTIEQAITSLLTPVGTIPNECGEGRCCTFYHYVWSQLVDDQTYDVCVDLAGRYRVAYDHLSGAVLAQAMGRLLDFNRHGWQAINLYLVQNQMPGMDIASLVHMAVKHSTEYIFILRTLGGRDCIISPLLSSVAKGHAFWSITFAERGIKTARVDEGELLYQFDTTNCTMQYTPLEETHRHEGNSNEDSECNAVREIRIL